MSEKKPAAKANGSFKAHFVLERETKGAVRYMQVNSNRTPLTIDAGAQIGTLYVRKSAFDTELPADITVTVSSGLV